ncbi:MAG TPA: hypothetical protein VF191_11070 [Cyclobacteriaceae bacterium]
MTKSATTLILVLIVLIASPIVFGIASAIFGVVTGLFGALIGIIGGVFGAFFGVIGGILSSGWVPVLILAVIIAAFLSGRR